MNCKTYKNHILLRRSGELGAIPQWTLGRHLSRCADCRRYDNETAAVLETARQYAPDEGAPDIEKILAFARKENSRSEEFHFRPSREPLLQQWKPALIYAGLSVLLLGAFLTVIAPVFETPRLHVQQRERAAQAGLAWDDGLDEELNELSDMLETAAHEWNNGSVSEFNEIEQLARELLELEGIQI